MQLLLQLYLIKDKQDYIPKAREVPPGYSSYDLDNFSDDLVVAMAIRAIKEAERIVLLIQAEPNTAIGSIVKVLNALVKSTAPLIVFFNGQHVQLEKMLARLNADSIYHQEDLSTIPGFK